MKRYESVFKKEERNESLQLKEGSFNQTVYVLNNVSLGYKEAAKTFKKIIDLIARLEISNSSVELASEGNCGAVYEPGYTLKLQVYLRPILSQHNTDSDYALEKEKIEVLKRSIKNLPNITITDLGLFIKI